jgi:DNA topoisomerase I
MPPVPRGLIYVSDAEPGITRIRRKPRGKGKAAPVRFDYFSPSGRRIREARTLERIAKLAIPPAYEKVWICTRPHGHLQATGRDARGRKQYRYHAQWRVARDGDKHARMLDFGRALERLRAAVRRDLRLPGLPKQKVLALLVKLLDATQVRIGNEEYARTNGSFGLTTLRDRHAHFPSRGKAVLQFRGKGGTEHDVAVNDARLAALVRRCQELPGQALFQYIDEKGAKHAIDSGQVNAYLRERMGGEFTAKDFRTWHATLHALKLLNATPLPETGSERALRQCINTVIKDVAAGLRNTPAVCRKSYINPAVFAAWQKGGLRHGDTRPVQVLMTLLKTAH